MIRRLRVFLILRLETSPPKFIFALPLDRTVADYREHSTFSLARQICTTMQR